MRQLRKQEAKKLFKEYKKQEESPRRAKEVVLVMENIQYARNVASIFRTADAAGVNKIYLTGISKQPPFGKELQQVSRKKEYSVQWEYHEQTVAAINKLKADGFTLIAIEITDNAIPLEKLREKAKDIDKIAFIAGSEVFGVNKQTLARCDLGVYIPMYGKGTSLNVTVSAGIVLFSF